MQQDNDVINYIKRAFELKSQDCYKQAIEMLYNYDRAVQYLEKVLQYNNKHLASLKLLSNVYSKQGLFEDALEPALKVYEIEQQCKNLKEIIIILGSMKRIDDIAKYRDIMDNEFRQSKRINCRS